MSLSVFFSSDPISGSLGSADRHPPPLHRPAQYVVAQSAAFATRCCVYPLPRDPARGSGKQRYDYSLTVVHFRKVVIRQKVGSHRKGEQVI